MAEKWREEWASAKVAVARNLGAGQCGGALIRQFSYAALLYVETRSGYVHEYMAGSRSDSWGMGSTHAMGCVSYTNRLNPSSGRIDRLIYFSVGWLADVVLSVAKNIRPVTPDSEFSDWWMPNEPKSA